MTNTQPKLNNDAIMAAIQAYGLPNRDRDRLAQRMLNVLSDIDPTIDNVPLGTDPDDRDHGQRIIDALEAALPLLTID